MQVSLVMFKADGTRREFPLNRPRTVVGRKNNCDLRIPLSSVSRQHCEIRLDNGEIRLRDLGSSNGTYHNHIRVQEATLEPGDEVVIGPVVFTVVVDGEPAEIEPVRTAVGGDEVGTGGARGSRPESPLAIGDEDDEDDEFPELAGLEDEPAGTDDPIAALDRMAEAERTGSSIDDELDDLDLDFDLDEDDDEDDDGKNRP